jgi:small subunit ribosomal protein S21
MGRYDDYKGERRTRNELEFRPIEVTVDGDNVDRAIKILKRKMADEGVFRELKKRRYYEKPSEAKKRKQREALRRRRKAARRR